MIRLKWIFTGILLGVVISCSSQFVASSLINRELVVHPDIPALAFPYCTKKNWFKKAECKIDIYNLTKPEVRKSLADFICVHISKLK